MDHGWYSRWADRFWGHLIYKRPDSSEVKVTSISQTFEWGRNYLWPDKKYLGEITEFVRKGTDGIFPQEFTEDVELAFEQLEEVTQWKKQITQNN